MLKIEVDEKFPNAYSKEIKEVSNKIATKVVNALNKALQKEKVKYERALKRTAKPLIRQKRFVRGSWAEFYKVLADELYAEKMETTPVMSFASMGGTGQEMFSVKTGFYAHDGSGGADIPSLYYTGKKRGKPTVPKNPAWEGVYVKATKGNPVSHTLIRGASRGRRSNKFTQSKGSRGRYVIPKGYQSPAWENKGKERFEKYIASIENAFQRESERVLSEMNR